jgi:hypothetical protein
VKIRSPYVLGELAKLGAQPRPKRPPRSGRPPSPIAPSEPGYHAAVMHVSMTRRKEDRDSTWFDVRDAYLAGYKAGYTAGKS